MIAALDPIRPYLWLAKWLGLAAIVAVLFVSGCNHGTKKQAERDEARIARKDEALRNAATALRGAGDAIEAINTEAQRRIREAEETAGRALEAGKVADAAKIEAMAESERFAADLERAKKRKPACAELAASLIDLEATCGLSVR